MGRQKNHTGDDRQLSAVEQQLRAAIQQLEASNRQLKASEEQLRAERKKEQEYLDVAATMMVAIDRGEKVTLINKKGCEVLGYEEKEVLGKNWFDNFLPGGVHKQARAVFRQLIAGKVKSVEYHESRVLTKTGQERIIAWHNAILTDDEGNVTDVLCSGMDITIRRRAEEKLSEEHNLIRTLIDNIPDHIYVKDSRSRFIMGNTAITHGMGAKGPEGLIGKTDFDFYSEKLAKRYYADEQQIIRTGKALINREEPVTDATGKKLWFLTTKVPFRDSYGNIAGFVGIGRDITLRKQAEEALKAANQQLRANHQQLKAANQQLRATEQQLRATNQQLDATNQQLRANEQQLKAANQQLQATEQQLRAANQQLRASEEELRQVNNDLRERIRELDCLYGLSLLDEQRDTSIEEIFAGVVELIPPAWRYPEITAVEIVFGDHRFKTNNFRKTCWTQSADIEVHGQKAGTIEVCYLKKRPAMDEGPFLKWQRNLLDALAEQLGHLAERKCAEQKILDYQAQLKSLASELTLTEEREKRRVAAEMHDQISQFLVISKVRLEALQRSTSSRKLAKSLKEICELVDQTIQNTRSLTFDLGSPILYELGFEAAVAEWLAEEVQQKYDIKTEFADDEQDKPLGADLRALLFRDVRELLINVVKHAHARKVKVSIQRVDRNICITVEDDGVGFDFIGVASIATKTGGFGLFSVRERLEQLGGHLEVESKPRHGCKVTLTAPLQCAKTDDGA